MNPVVTGSVCSRNVTVVVLAAAMGIETSLAHLLYAGSVRTRIEDVGARVS